MAMSDRQAGAVVDLLMEKLGHEPDPATFDRYVTAVRDCGGSYDEALAGARDLLLSTATWPPLDALLAAIQARGSEPASSLFDPATPERERVRAIIADARARLNAARSEPPKPRKCPTCGADWPLVRPSAEELAEMGLSGAV